MLFAEQDRAAGEVHERGAERAGKTAAFRAHQVDIRLAVDLRAAEEKVIDAALPREVEQLARALGERVAFALVQPRDPDRAALRAQQLARGGRDRRRSADRHVMSVGDEPRNYAGKELFVARQTCSSRERWNPSRVFAAAAYAIRLAASTT